MERFFSLLRKNVLGLKRYPAVLLVSWLLVSLSLPFLKLVFGLQTMLQGLALAILIQTLLVLDLLFHAWGWWRLLRIALGVILLVWAALAINLRSEYPFGAIQYSNSLQPQVMGVPILLPAAWLMMLPPAWAIGRLVTRRLSGCLVHPAFAVVSAIAFTAVDFYLDPLMTYLGLYSWGTPGGFQGVPWLNFISWMLLTGVISFSISTRQLPITILLVVYGLTWLVGLICLLFFGGLLVPALVGFCLMGGMFTWAAISTR